MTEKRERAVKEKPLTSSSANQTAGRFPWTNRAIVVALALLAVVFTFTFLKINTVSVISAQDEGALYYGARSLLDTGSVRVANPLAEEYGSNVVGNVFTVYRSPDEYYYRAFPGSIILDAGLLAIGGDSLFWLSNAIFGSLAVLGVFLLAYKLTRSPLPAALAAMLLATSPVFVHWGVTHFHHVPVLAFEVFAFYFVLGPSRLRKGELVAAGVCIGAALFLRSADMLVGLVLVAIVVWRTRSVAQTAWTVAPIAAFGTALALVNLWLYGSPLFQPHIAPAFLAEGAQVAGPGTIERYALYLLGTEGSITDIDVPALFSNYWFHVQYFVRSSFAFPLLMPALVGVIVGVARGWRPMAGVAAAFIAVLGVTIFVYGNQRDNYFGFDENLVRSSFIRYLLLVYALLAVTGGISAARLYTWLTSQVQSRLHLTATALDVRVQLAALALFAAAIAAISMIGIVGSQDEERYGLDRLNLYRNLEITEQTNINSLAERDGQEPLLLTGVNTRKLVDLARYPNTVDYSVIPREHWSTELLPLVRGAMADRSVYVLATTSQQPDGDLLDFLREGGVSLLPSPIGNDSFFQVVESYEAVLRDSLRLHDGELVARSLTENPALLWQDDGQLSAWSRNGFVVMEPLAEDGASGVLARNSAQWGGIRQVIDASALGRQTVTAIVSLAGSGPQPAREAVVTLAREGEAPFESVVVQLEAGEQLATLEVKLPAGIGLLRITVATGTGDDGDLAIQQIYLIPESLQEIVESLEPRTVQNSGGS